MILKAFFDQVSSSIFKKIGKIDSRDSCLAMRNYIDQLDDLQLKPKLKEE